MLILNHNFKKKLPINTKCMLAALLVFHYNICIQTLAYAQTGEYGKETDQITPRELEQPQNNNPYFTVQAGTTTEGLALREHVINGPSVPPPGYDLERAAVPLPKSNRRQGIKTLTVPAYTWVFGCSPVAAAMIAGYHDRNGYPNIYTGPANGGSMPLNNSGWPTWTDGYREYPNLPLAASHQGVDGRTTRGSIDDYWIKYDSSDDDPYITNNWPEHSWGDAIGDYMKTSQSTYNPDGATMFHYVFNSPGKAPCDYMIEYHITNDGTLGRKIFYEAKGYAVTECYTQFTDNNVSGGFSFDQFKNEIDADRPVMINLSGHTVVGIGYDDATRTIYIHDTWDYDTHTMTWGGRYSGMALESVSIVNLESNPCTFSLTPESKTFSSLAGSQIITIGASAPTCPWTGTEDLDWLSLAPANGTGNGYTTITVTPNNTTSTRTGSIVIGGQIFSVTQTPTPIITPLLSPAPQLIWLFQIQIAQGRLCGASLFPLHLANENSFAKQRWPQRIALHTYKYAYENTTGQPTGVRSDQVTQDLRRGKRFDSRHGCAAPARAASQGYGCRDTSLRGIPSEGSHWFPRMPGALCSISFRRTIRNACAGETIPGTFYRKVKKFPEFPFGNHS